MTRCMRPAQAMLVAHELPSLPSAYWVEPQPMYTTANADAAALTQSGSGTGVAAGGLPIGIRAYL